MITSLYTHAPLILPPWQVAAITAQGITVRYPDDLTPVRIPNAAAHDQDCHHD